MRYPGGKNGAGVYQTIINHMPPHRTYIELFLGSAAIMRNKRQAEINIGIDLDDTLFTDDLTLRRGFKFYGMCAMKFMERTFEPCMDTRETLIYADPPYVHSTRFKTNLYQHEMTDEDHDRVLELLCSTNCNVMISGYDNPLYAARLCGWSRIKYNAMTRGGVRQETLWFNFPQPTALHDYRYLGEGYRERERIKRKKERWAMKLAALPTLERQAILAAFDEGGFLQQQN